MQLPDEAIEFQYQGLLLSPGEEWTPTAEVRARHYLAPARLKSLSQQMVQLRGQVAAERELQQVPPELQPLEPGFIDQPQKLLDQFRRRGETSVLGRVLARAARLREQVDRVVVVGIGGSYLGARALFEALCHSYHNELPPKARLGNPRIYFEGNNVDNDSLQALLELFEHSCVDPAIRDERWGMIVISKSGGTLEPAVAYRILRQEFARFYGSNPKKFHDLVVPVTGEKGKLQNLCLADGFPEDDVFTIPDRIGGRYSVFTPAGLLPAAVMGLDIRALLLGAAAMTRRFLEEPFERNPVLQYAAVNHLMTEEMVHPIRVLACWSKKLEGLGLWHDQLIAESLGKHGKGPTPITAIQTRDLHSRGQQHQEGTRDKLIINLVVKSPRTPPIAVGMADRNEDELNALSRKTLQDLMTAALQGTNKAYHEVARPTADLVLPTLSEHALGQVMQLLMLATVLEGRLMGVNPYGQPGVEAYKRNMRAALR